MYWGAANARARGLATHLLDRDTLERAAAAGSWGAGTRLLFRQGYSGSVEADRLNPERLDRTVGRVLASRLALLGRWLGPGVAALAVVYDDIERRVLQILLRGAVQGAPPISRLRYTSATPALPDRLLERLARAESPELVVAGLLRSGHPAGRALHQVVRGPRRESGPGVLWRLELALSRWFALRVTRLAHSAGPALRRFVTALLDLENAAALLLRSGWGDGVSATEVFLPGGGRLDLASFVRIAGLADRAAVEPALEERFAGTPLQGIAAEAPAPLCDWETRVLAALLAWQRREARRDPLGAGVLLWVVLRCRGEAHDVRLVSSALQLDVPPSLAAAALVTPA